MKWIIKKSKIIAYMLSKLLKTLWQLAARITKTSKPIVIKFGVLVFSLWLLVKRFFSVKLDQNAKKELGSAQYAIFETIEKSGKMIAILGSLLLIWMATARINSSVVGSGVLIPNSKKRIVQHFEGGMIDQILVQEGDMVELNEPLVKLDETQASANYESNKSNLASIAIKKARIEIELKNCENTLKAVNDNDINMAFEQYYQIPRHEIEKIVDFDDSRVENIFEAERLLLANNIGLYRNQLEILRSKIIQNYVQITEYENTIKNIKDKINIAKQQLNIEVKLKKRGVADHEKLLSFKRELLSLKTEFNNAKIALDSAKLKDRENQIEMRTTMEERYGKLSAELHEMQLKLHEAVAKNTISENIANRALITSPVRGIVTMIHVNGRGQNINPSTEIMEVVPIDDNLVIEAKIAPKDISLIYPGLSATVMPILTNSKILPRLQGKVLHVSHDVKNSPDGNSYFIAKISLDNKELDKLKKIKLVPGMNAQVFVSVGEKWFLLYIFEPLYYSILLSFNEA